MYITNIKNTKELKTPHNKSIRWLLPKEIGVPSFEMRYFEVKKESVPSEDDVTATGTIVAGRRGTGGIREVTARYS